MKHLQVFENFLYEAGLDSAPDVMLEKEKEKQAKLLDTITLEKGLMAKINANQTTREVDKIMNNSKHVMNISRAYTAIGKSMATQSQLMLKQAAQQKKA